MNRRALLAGIGGAVSVSLSGCVLYQMDGVDPSEENESGNGDPNSTTETPPGSPEVGLVQGDDYEMSGPPPKFAVDAEPPIVLHIPSMAEAKTAFAATRDEDKEPHPFIAETDFDRESLFYVETSAPNACHTFTINSVAVTEENTLTGTIASRDTSEEGMDCASVIVYPSRLIRVTTTDNGQPPTSARLTVQDGWGETKTVESMVPSEYPERED